MNYCQYCGCRFESYIRTALYCSESCSKAGEFGKNDRKKEEALEYIRARMY